MNLNQVTFAYDAFASYNSRQSKLVEEICIWLEDYGGLNIWKDNWELTGGDNWIEKLPEAIVKSKAIIVFIGKDGIGPWHNEEINYGLQQHIKNKLIRIIPVILPEAPDNPNIPPFLNARNYVDLRNFDEWEKYKLRCAIVGKPPGRKDLFEKDANFKQGKSPKLVIQECNEVSHYPNYYTYKLRIANPNQFESIIVSNSTVRSWKVANHPISNLLPQYLGPIGRYKEPKKLNIPNQIGMSWIKLTQQRYLKPNEVEDIELLLNPRAGFRNVISIGLHWQLVDEPLTRLSEVGFFAIGMRGSSNGVIANEEGLDDYVPGQHNLDISKILTTPEWPNGWPNAFDENEYYR